MSAGRNEADNRVVAAATLTKMASVIAGHRKLVAADRIDASVWPSPPENYKSAMGLMPRQVRNRVATRSSDFAHEISKAENEGCNGAESQHTGYFLLRAPMGIERPYCQRRVNAMISQA